jgi:hypothetical protein
LIRCFIVCLIRWLIGSVICRLIFCIDSLINCFLDSLIHWFIDSLVPWFIDSLVHWFIGSFCQLCMDLLMLFHLSHHVLIRWCTSPCNFTTSLLLHLKYFPIGHNFL